MKTKFFFLLLVAVLLGSVSVKAQSETPLKGDVNGDGKVDVADIVAVIEIMKNNGGTTETKYYWYCGQTMPESMDSDPEVDDVNFTCNKWHTIGTTLVNIHKTSTGGVSGEENWWYVAVPKGKYQPTAGDEVTPNTSWKIVKNITINTIEYDVFNTYNHGKTCAAVLAVKQ